ncbi:DM13 domain-containing protein [Streptomyces sp. DSM 15324]|uniref:DM13 domain-containing protein n=1 Tax=Streptomyces sp. DSM 15324 TaxID=1739111 RepID=UPI002D21AD5F|nr:DM13 domain-containing protein [Streptomyces sp. DSM 15324]
MPVWLSDQPVQGDGGNLDDGEHIYLGSLKGNAGNQNHAIPASAGLGRFSTVTIWCERFSVSPARPNRTGRPDGCQDRFTAVASPGTR